MTSLIVRVIYSLWFVQFISAVCVYDKIQGEGSISRLYLLNNSQLSRFATGKQRKIPGQTTFIYSSDRYITKYSLFLTLEIVDSRRIIPKKMY